MKTGGLTYFNDITFLQSNDSPRHTASCSRRMFEGYYGIQFIYGGSVRVSVNDNPPEISDQPVVVITYPGAAFAYGCPRPGTFRSQAYICFFGNRVRSYLAGGLLEPREKNLLIPIRRPHELLALMRDTMGCMKIPDRYHKALSVLKLDEILLYIATQSDTVSPGHSKYSVQIQELSQKIAAAPLLDWDFGKEAGKMFLSYVHFRHIFKNMVGMSPWNYVLECRIGYAAEQIATTTKRISDIAFETGFNDKFYFSRKFRERFQKSPSEHRKLFGNS